MRSSTRIVLAASWMAAAMVGSWRAAGALARFSSSPPVLDGIVSPGEWDGAEVEFDTGARPALEACPGPWNRSGCRAKFYWDETQVYGLLEAYSGSLEAGHLENGPFSYVHWEVYVDGKGCHPAFVLDTARPSNNVNGSRVAFGNDAGGPGHMRIEFSLPLLAIVDRTGANGPIPYRFNPRAGDFLEYRVRTLSAAGAGGFDSRDQSCGWSVAPQETVGGYRKLLFAPEPVAVDLRTWSGVKALFR